AANQQPYKIASMGAAVPAHSNDPGSSFWVQGFGEWLQTKDTISGPGFHTTNLGAAIGWDTYVNPNLLLGVAGSYTAESNVTFKPFGSSTGAKGRYTGFEVGGYGRYDADEGFYLSANAEYGHYNNKTSRFVTL